MRGLCFHPVLKENVVGPNQSVLFPNSRPMWSKYMPTVFRFHFIIIIIILFFIYLFLIIIIFIFFLLYFILFYLLAHLSLWLTGEPIV